MQRKSRNKLLTKVFSACGADDSHQGCVCPEGGGASAIAGAPLLFDTPLGKRFKESAFYRSYVEGAVCDFKVGGYKKGHRLALKEYRSLRWRLENKKARSAIRAGKKKI